MRLFIAIPIPEEVKDYIISMQKEFYSEFDKFSLRFVKKEHMHITIDFLGEIPDDKIGSIVSELKEIRFNLIKIKLSSLGSFPSKDTVRVIWIGIEENEEFIRLQKGIREIFNHRDKLMPHLTIARAKSIIKDRRLSDKINSFKIESKEFDVDKFILYRSDFQKDDVVHTILEEFKPG